MTRKKDGSSTSASIHTQSSHTSAPEHSDSFPMLASITTVSDEQCANSLGKYESLPLLLYDSEYEEDDDDDDEDDDDDVEEILESSTKSCMPQLEPDSDSESDDNEDDIDDTDINEDVGECHVSSDISTKPSIAIKQGSMTSSFKWGLEYATIAAVPDSLKKSQLPIKINDKQSSSLVDTGSSDTFIDLKEAKRLKLEVNFVKTSITLAESSVKVNSLGYVVVDLNILDYLHENVRVPVVQNLCAPVIIGQDILQMYTSLTINFGGNLPPLSFCGLTTINAPAPPLFDNLAANCRPIVTKSRRYSPADRKFVDAEIQRLLSEDIIEPSNSPWRAQVVVTSDERHKKRMVVDYSQTVNRFTQKDAFPLPRIDDQVNEIANNTVFSTIDLKDAYYQVALSEEDKKYTTFEANGQLYQYKRMPFRVTNGVACFQRAMTKFIIDNNLKGTYAYIDNITVCGNDQEEHDVNLQAFLKAAKDNNLLFNWDKCVFSTDKLQLLGYEVHNKEIRPDPARLQPLRDLPPPSNLKHQKKVVGLFSYYSKWIRNFSDKIRALSKNTEFPLPETALQAFVQLKQDIEDSVVIAIDESLEFEVETDASDFAIAAVLNQGGRPVAFFSRVLQKSEIFHSPVEKEASAIVESVRYWRHYLLGRHFTLITDQEPCSFMFNNKRNTKIKNDKIQRWRMELACYNFDIQYRPGEENVPADSFTRLFCSAISTGKLAELHSSLCHPGVTRMFHFVKSKNLAVSLEEVKAVTKSCRVCAECKPRFYKTEHTPLIKATQPFERVSVDFKGPLPSVSKNRYFLTVVDEYSRFPFAIPCADMQSSTVIKCLSSIFSMFGNPAYVHNDRAPDFLSKELTDWLHSRNIATSRTTSYNPQGNGQCERYNGIIWKAITLACKSRNLDMKYWEVVVPDALHSIRSLLCTATNTTPHDRIFNFARRSSHGESLPSWLCEPGTVLKKVHVRRSKYDPLTEEVELIDANPSYAHIRYPDGREDTVSLRHLAPSGNNIGPEEMISPLPENSISVPSEMSSKIAPVPANEDLLHNYETVPNNNAEPETQLSPTTPIKVLRRSQRQNLGKTPDRLTYD